MAIPVYVQAVTTYPGRTEWSNTADYVVGDRVYYADSTSDYSVYVCIQDHSISGSDTPQQPDLSPNYWQAAGSKEYPFLTGSSNNIYTSGFGATEFCLRTSNGFTNNWDPARYLSISDGSERAHVILMDGLFDSGYIGSAYMDLTNTDFYSENFQESWFIFRYYDHVSTTENCPTFNNLKIGLHNANVSFDCPVILNNCLISDSSPYTTRTSVKATQRFQYGKFIQAKDCIFDFSMCSNNLLINNAPASSKFGLNFLKNCTFIFAKQENQYPGMFGQGSDLIVDKCIFYIKGLVEMPTPKVSINSMVSFTNSCVFAESFADVDHFVAGHPTLENDTNLLNVYPLFLDIENSDYRLRPSSPLIGGTQSQNILATKHPNGVWVDHNHTPVQSSHDYTLESGDGTNYTFSGSATGSDPTLTSINIQDTLTFTNNTGGHPLAIYNSEGLEVASESSGTTTFTPKYPGTYYYQCTAPGHENMRGDIVVTKGTLGSYSNPFGGYYDAIDAGYYDNSATLLFKKGDHQLYLQNPVNYGSGNTSISSSFPGGLFFIGEDAETTRFTTGNNMNGFSAFYVGTFDSTTPQAQTPLSIESIGFHVNNTISQVGRGIFSGVHWKSFSLKSSKVTCGPASAINSTPFDYNSSVVSPGYEFSLSGCEVNLPLSDNNGPGASFLSGSLNIKYAVESCTFTKLDGYNYVHNGESPIMVSGGFSPTNNSSIKNCIFYSNVGQTFCQYNIPAGVFSSCILHSTTNSFTGLPADMDVNSSEDPLFISVQAGQEDLRLQPNSFGIGGLTVEPSNIYYLQPENPYNGDGSQKDASAMTADGDPGPFNEFKEIVAAGVPYGSTIIILNGTYNWTESFGRTPSSNVSASTWYAYTLAGYNYVAETMHEVIFDAKLDTDNVFVYKPYGGPVPGPSTGTFLDLHTTFTGIQFNNMIGNDQTTRNMIGSVSGAAGQGSCSFKNCKFLGHINKGSAYNYPWTGGGRDINSSTMHWNGCEISIAFDNPGGLLCGGDGFASDELHGAWSWENCTFYIPTGMTTFNGRNAFNGTYVSPYLIFGRSFTQSKRIFKNNIIQIENGTAEIGLITSDKLPSIENNCLNGVAPIYTASNSSITDHSEILNSKNNLFGTDPLFIEPSINNFGLRPLSPLIGQGK